MSYRHEVIKDSDGGYGMVHYRLNEAAGGLLVAATELARTEPRFSPWPTEPPVVSQSGLLLVGGMSYWPRPGGSQSAEHLELGIDCGDLGEFRTQGAGHWERLLRQIGNTTGITLSLTEGPRVTSYTGDTGDGVIERVSFVAFPAELEALEEMQSAVTQAIRSPVDDTIPTGQYW